MGGQNIDRRMNGWINGLKENKWMDGKQTDDGQMDGWMGVQKIDDR